MNVVLAGVFVYVLVQLAIGLWVARRVRTEDDYLLAGRRFGYGLATFSIFATWFGAETCVGAAGAIYAEGLSAGKADPFGYAACLLLMTVVFARALWARGLTTLADLFRERFSRGVERTAVLLMVPTSVLWAAAQIRAFGQVLSAVSTFQFDLCVAVAALVVIVYTAAGGLLADAITDLVQGGALIVGLLVVLVAVLDRTGGIQAGLSAVPAERLTLFAAGDVFGTLDGWLVPVCGSVVAQELVSRVLASRSSQVAYRSGWMATGLYLVVGLVPVFIGLVGPRLIPNLSDPEQLLPQLASRTLPTFGYILFAGALVSAILSTVDSTLLAASALFSHNLLVPLRPSLSERGKARSARLCVVLFGVVAYVLARFGGGVYELVESASSFGSAGIFVIVVFGLFTRFGQAPSAFAALVVGTSAWLLFSFVVPLPAPYLLSLVLAFVSYAAFARAGALGQLARSG